MSDALTADALKLWIVLSRTVRALAAHAERDVAHHGLTLAEFGALEALYHKGPLLLGELQRKILVSSGGMTYLIDRLARRGLVSRRPCPEDGRARYAALTPEGERLVARIFPAHADAIEQAVRGITPDERRKTTALLRRLGLEAERLLGEEKQRGQKDDSAGRPGRLAKTKAAD
jgi:MarR family 2-MHQ and catechol resistance regulon transcriptional repressor